MKNHLVYIHHGINNVEYVGDFSEEDIENDEVYNAVDLYKEEFLFLVSKSEDNGNKVCIYEIRSNENTYDNVCDCIGIGCNKCLMVDW